MPYQNCRWYDVYPGLVFVLKLIQLMPAERQAYIGERLNQFLAHRSVSSVISYENLLRGNRWYDAVPSLVDSLERLQRAPHVVKHQSSDFLISLLDDDETKYNCA